MLFVVLMGMTHIFAQIFRVIKMPLKLSTNLKYLLPLQASTYLHL
nr:hypothetical protein Q903MT_gene6210 [Picea sitchensis]